MVSREGGKGLVPLVLDRAEPLGVVSNATSMLPCKSAIRRFSGLLRECGRSRFGWILAAIHVFWFYLAIRSMGPPSRAAASFLDSFQGADWTLFAGRPFHYTYQSWILKSLRWADNAFHAYRIRLWTIVVATRVH